MIYILADIHANLSALTSTYKDMLTCGFDPKKDKIIILGDLVDYGMRPNQVIEFISQHLSSAIIIEGNHENAILTGNLEQFSHNIGRQCAQYTSSVLTKNSFAFLKTIKNKGKKEVTMDGKKLLMVHGSLADYYWGSIDTQVDPQEYKNFDVVLNAHTHKRLLFTKYIQDDNSEMRNKKAIIFCNPGSVGQPRNHIAKAQYCISDYDLENFNFRAVAYDIKSEQKLWNKEIDIFYKDRLLVGV